jgi:CheY-like chemotaxis protein
MKNFKILVADDIFVNRLLLSEILADLGYECMQAEDGKKAIEIIDSQNVDMVLMDIEMPVMNGLETTEYIRKNMGAGKKSIPIIALTAHNPNLFFDDYTDAGFTKLITKPYSIEKISDLIAEFDPESQK